MDEFVGASKLMGTKAVVLNVANFAPPAQGQPALLTSDDVKTMFHEFGHALHGMFFAMDYPTLEQVANDFAEFPTQFNERWATYPSIFKNYAKHYKTDGRATLATSGTAAMRPSITPTSGRRC